MIKFKSLNHSKDFVKILKKTKSMVFLICHLQCKGKIIASASGIWKILKIKPSDLSPDG